MNDHVFQAQYTLRLVCNNVPRIFEVYRHDSPDLRYTLETACNDTTILRFDMMRTTIGQWIIVGEVPEEITKHAQEIGRSILESCDTDV